MTDRLGQQFGNYRLMRLLGRGGFADVYLGEHIYLKTEAAIKILNARITGEDTTHFLTEAQTVAKLRHKNIVAVLDFAVSSEGDPFFVMEYAPNGSLRTLHPRGTRLPLELVVSYTKQVASALQYAHGQRLVHCDIKPENMLLNRSNDILLSDFGIAVISHTTASQQVQQQVYGTTSYMAPEQIQGRPSPASDQYALGIVIYEWLTGVCPFQGSFTQVAVQHMFASPESMRELVPTIPPEVEQVVLHALAKDPKDRFLRVEALANALEQASQMEMNGGHTLASSSEPTFIKQSSTAPTVAAGPLGEIPPFTPLIIPTANTPAVPFEATSAQSGATSSQPPSDPVRRLMSRRAVIVGLVGIAAVASGSTIFALAQKTGPSPTPTPIVQKSATPSPPTPHPTATNQPITVQPQPTSPPPTVAPQPTTQPGVLPLATYTGPSSMYTVSWSPNGTLVASGGLGQTVQVWNAANGSRLLSYNGNADKVYSVMWSPDGTRIVSGHSDGTVQVWNASSGTTIFSQRGHSKRVNAVAWSPDGTRVVSGSGDTTVKVWDVALGRLLLTYSGHSKFVDGVAWSHDGSRIGSCGATAQVWDASSGSTLTTYSGHSGEVVSLAWSRDDSRIVTGGVDTTVQVWGSGSGSTSFTYRGHSDFVNAVAWSPDGTRIVSGSRDRTAQVWDASSGNSIRAYRRHSDAVESVTWSPDSTKVASASDDGTVQVWSAS